MTAQARPLFGILLLFATAAFPAKDAAAETLDPAHVPADAKWLLHVDYDAMSESQLFETIRQQNPRAVEGIANWLSSRYGINPEQDLHSVTMFSRDYRRYTGTIVMQTDYQPEKIEAVLRKEQNYQTSNVAGQTLHTVTLSKQKESGPSGDETMTVVMLNPTTLIIASSPQTAEETIQLLSGDSPSLAGTDSPLLSEDSGTAWLYGAATELGRLAEHPVSMPVLSQHERIVWSLGSHGDGKLYERGDFVAQSEEVAANMEQVLKGLVAWETLWADGSPAMSELVKDVEIARNGETVSFQWQGKTDTLLAAMGDIAQRYQSWKALFNEKR